MWIWKWQLVIFCLCKLVTTLDICENTLNQVDLSLITKIKTFLSSVHKSGIDKACDNQLVSDYLMKEYNINYVVPYIIETSDETIQSEDDYVPDINGEVKITFLPEMSFVRTQNYSASLWSVKSNFTEGSMNGKKFFLRFH